MKQLRRWSAIGSVVSILLVAASTIGSAPSSASTAGATARAGVVRISSDVHLTASLGETKSEIIGQLKKDETRPTSIGYNVPFKGKIPKNKTIDFMACGAPSCVTVGAALQQAVQALGWKFREVNTGSTPQTIQAAWQSIVQDPPSAAVSIAYDSSIFKSALDQLAAKGVPVVLQASHDVAGGPVTAMYAGFPFFCAAGQALARYVIVNGGSSAQSVLFQTSTLDTTTEAQDCYSSFMKANCATCQVTTVQVPIADIGVADTTQMVSWLTAHPSVKWAYTSFVDLTTGLPQALAAAGIHGVKIVTYNSNAAQNAEIKAGDGVAAAIEFPLTEINYHAADVILRKLSGQPTQQAINASVPLWLVTKSNVPTNPNIIVTKGPAQFEKLWGIK